MSVYASSVPNLTITFDKFRDDIENLPDENDVFDVLLRMVGLPVSASKFFATLPIATIKDLLGLDPSTNLKDYVLDHVSDNDGKPEFDSTLHDDVKDIGNYFIENNINYVYSYTNYELAGLYSSADAYVKANNMIQSNIVSQQYWFLTSYSGINRLYSVSKSQYPYLYLRIDQVNRADNFAQGYLVDGLTNTILDGSNVDMYQYNGTEWVSSTYFDNVTIGVLFDNQSFVRPVNRNSNKFFVSLDDRIVLRANVGTATSADVLYQSYYVNEDVWNDFSSTSGDYTFDNSNVNTVSYGDITNYIDSFNQENGYPPSIPDININIENQNNDNITGGSGGGSGDDGSGGGSGDNESGSGILGILSRLGSLIGNLIEGIGLFLTGIVEGLVNALTSLLESLSGLITGTLENLTNIFTGLIGFVYGGLPSEIQAVLLLALSVSLLITIIDLIRGR